MEPGAHCGALRRARPPRVRAVGAPAALVRAQRGRKHACPGAWRSSEGAGLGPALGAASRPGALAAPRGAGAQPPRRARGQVGKELGAGTYRLISYFSAKTLVSVPFETGVAIIFSVIVYNMIGFQASAAKFFLFMATLVLVNLTSDMVGFICGVLTKARRCAARARLHAFVMPATRLRWPRWTAAWSALACSVSRGVESSARAGAERAARRAGRVHRPHPHLGRDLLLLCVLGLHRAAHPVLLRLVA